MNIVYILSIDNGTVASVAKDYVVDYVFPMLLIFNKTIKSWPDYVYSFTLYIRTHVQETTGETASTYDMPLKLCMLHGCV